MNDKTVYLSDVLDILESLEKEADRQDDAKSYVALMNAADRIQKLSEARKDK